MMKRLMVFSLILLQRRQLIEAATVAFGSVESRGEEDLHQLPRQCVAGHESTQTDDIQIVVLHALMG